MNAIESLKPAFCRPWRCIGTTMAPNALVMCKLLFLLMLVHGFHRYITDPYLPFIGAFDQLRIWPGVFPTTLLVLYFGAGAMLLCNIAVRAAAVTLGLTMLAVLLASKPIFANHRFIVAVLFLLAGLHRKGEHPWLIHIQMSVIYFGAFLNKIVEPDWHSGRVMHSWFYIEESNPWYRFLFDQAPWVPMAELLAWIAMLSELALAIGFLLPRTRLMTVWLAIAFHGGLYLMTFGMRFGHFLEDLLLAYMAFTVWPQAVMSIRLRAGGPRRGVSAIARVVHWDGAVRLDGEPRGGRWMELHVGDEAHTDEAALRYLILRSAGLYFILFAMYAAGILLLPKPAFAILGAIVGGLLCVFFFPVSWRRPQSKPSPAGQAARLASRARFHR